MFYMLYVTERNKVCIVLYCSNIDVKDSWAHQILQGPIEISKGPLKSCNLHVFEWDMGHWPILWAHHQFCPGLSLT